MRGSVAGSLLVILFSIQCMKAQAAEKIVFMQEVGSKKQLVLKSMGQDEVVVLPTKTKIALYPSLTADSRRVAFVGGEDVDSLDVYILSLETGSVQRLTHRGGLVLHPSFSKQGNLIAYSFNSPVHNRQLFAIYDLDQKAEQVIDLGGSVYFPRLSSNGEFVVFQKNVEGQGRKIFRYYLNQVEPITEPELISFENDSCMAPSVSFNDSSVLFTCKVEERWNVYQRVLSENNIQQVTDTDYQDFAPVYDRASNVIFASNRSGNFKIYKKFHIKDESFKSQPATLIHGGEGDFYAPSISGEDSWNQAVLPPFPEPRSSFATVQLGENIYVIGGHQGPEHTYPEESFTDYVHAFNLNTKQWRALAPRPAKAHGYGAESCNGKIYAFGGFAYSQNHKPKWTSLDQVDRFDPLTNSWKTLETRLPRRRSSNVVLKDNNKIYLIGGWNSTPKFEDDYDGRFHGEIDVFDCESETFETLSLSLSQPLRRAFSGVAKNGKLYLLGGISEGASHFNLLDNVTVLDLSTMSFDEMHPLPAPSFAPAAGFLGDQLFLFGGMLRIAEFYYTYVNHIIQLDISSQKPFWQNTGRFLTESKGFSQVLSIEDKIYILGGHTYVGQEDRPSNKVELFY